MKILLVDDDAFLRDMYASKFISCGHEVEVADSSSSAILKLQNNNKYDLLILDMVMPGTSGVELLKIIKERFPLNIKDCIFLSNQGQEEDIREATEAGAIGYIVKAHSIPSEVVKTVEKIVVEHLNK
ncbi:MAG: two-component system, OmpR family, response regulator [Patescibacteria group bacterium]|nr:two-component system, OmpR family, response regulator [Patescibacteria group bacterium]